MQEHYSTKGQHLTFTERQLIERWYNRDHKKYREIGRLLNKHHTTISNEIKRGQVKLKTKVKYSAQKGQEVYESNRERSKRPIKLTDELNKRISQGIKAKYSLEMIHQELETAVCLRTLYN